MEVRIMESDGGELTNNEKDVRLLKAAGEIPEFNEIKKRWAIASRMR
jgi:hypothetical protein